MRALRALPSGRLDTQKDSLISRLALSAERTPATAGCLGVRIAEDKPLADKKSLLFLNGTVLDYDTNLVSKGFVFSNPNAKTTCGCGSSFGA